MAVSLLVCLSESDDSLYSNIEFFKSETWNAEAEVQLILDLQMLLNMVRSQAENLTVNINLRVENSLEIKNNIFNRTKTKLQDTKQKLSARELQVLELIKHGLTNKKISERLFISYETVRSHRKNIFEKTGAQNAATLIDHYHQWVVNKD